MERSDLLEANGGIFTVQGKALSDSANPSVRVLVVGNPANTNCLIAMRNAPGIADGQFNRHDPSRPQPGRRPARRQGWHVGQRRDPHDHLGQPLRHPVPPTSSTPRVGGHNAAALVDDQAWLEDDFIPTVQQRGAAIINARGASSAASAASAAVDHMRDWASGTPGGDWVSMGIPSTGDYGAPDGIITSLPRHRLGRPVPRGHRPRPRRLQPRPHRSLLGRTRRRTRRRSRHGPPRLTHPPVAERRQNHPAEVRRDV